jgi:nitroreductase
MSIKSATPDHEILPLIAERWSPRAFSPQQIGASDLQRLFEAARWAASCFGEQPWSWVVADKEDAEGHARLASCLSAGNAWAIEAPVLALSVAKLNFDQSGKPNRYAFHDVGAAMATLCLQATSMNIHVHQMGGFDVEKARHVCAVPEGHDPVAMIAMGYLGDPSVLNEDQRKKETTPRQRKPISKFVFGAKWGQASGIVR